MKRLLTIVMAGLLLAAFVVPAFAWEFSLTGQYEYRFRYYGRTGPNDLFGNANTQFDKDNIDTYVAGYDTVPGAGATNLGIPKLVVNSVGFAGPNIYGRGAAYATGAADPLNGYAAFNSTFGETPGAANMGITRGGFSRWGSDALYNDNRLRLHPYIRVNNAIRVHGVYNIGGIRNKYVQHKYAQIGTPVGNAGPSAAAFAMSNVPSAGMAPFENWQMFQCDDMAYDTIGIGSWEQLRATIQFPWGILSIGNKDFPFGLGGATAYLTRSTSWLLVVPYGPFRLMGAFYLARGGAGNALWGGNSMYLHNTVPDGASKPTQFWAFPIVTYQAGSIDAGGAWIHQEHHSEAGDNPSSKGVGKDSVTEFVELYGKFNNGRFFANAEYIFANVSNYSASNPLGAIGATTAPYLRPAFLEYYQLTAEVGVYAGPAKLSLQWAQASGGVLNVENPTKKYSKWAIDHEVMAPYQTLIFETYGGGNQTYGGLFIGSGGFGNLGDAFSFAGRLDYAVAANLNAWGSFLWAHRLEKAGTRIGQYNSVGLEASKDDRNLFRNLLGLLPEAKTGAPLYVEDGYLGWEANVGVDWKLLEGLTLKAKYAYWQPGEWFKFAYQAVAVMSDGTVTNNACLGTRDAINSMQASLIIDF